MVGLKSDYLAIIGIIVSILAFIPSDYRPFAAIVFIAAMVLYFTDKVSNEVNTYEDRIKKLEENFRLHEKMIDLKSDVEYLKKEVAKRK